MTQAPTRPGGAVSPTPGLALATDPLLRRTVSGGDPVAAVLARAAVTGLPLHPLPGSRTSPLRVAVIGPSRHSLVEPFAGGQESLVATLVRQLRRRGHSVRLYAAAGTDPGLADELVEHATVPELSAVSAIDPHLPEPAFLSEHHAYTGVVADLLSDAGRVDVILNHSLHHLPLTMSRALPAPVVTTLHTPPFPWIELGAALADERARFVAVSRFQAAQWTTLPHVPEVIANGVDAERFPAGPGGGDLLWVGRITPEKGVTLAVRAAREHGRRLRLLGPRSDVAYFDTEVAPLLGGDVTYEGHLGHDEVAEQLRAAAALVVTPVWDEPFGLVAAEALMSATPVLALARGGLPEVVGPAGVLVAAGSDDEMIRGLAAAMSRVDDFDRAEVRRWAQERLSAERMTSRYESVMHRALRAAA